MADKLRCGVIGTGAIGGSHIESLGRTPRADVVAIAENIPQVARQICDQFRIPRCYSDYRELLDQPDIDAVTIAVPNDLHSTIAIHALKAGKHVLVEKPMALNAREAARMIEAAGKARRTLMVGQNFRFLRDTQLARERIARGDLGQIYHARAFFLRRNCIPRIGSWFTQKSRAGGGCTIDLGSHLLDTALYLINDFNVTAVSAQFHSRFGPAGIGEMDWGKSTVDPSKPFDVEDHSAALLRFQNGRSLILESSWHAFHPPDAREYGVDLYGSNAGLTLYPARLHRNGPNGYELTQLSSPKVPYAEDRLHHFVNAVLDGKKPIVTLDESLQLQKILDALNASAESGKEVRLK